MPLESEERKILVEYRQEKADRAIIEAKDNARLGHWTLAANRLYYAVFHIQAAVLCFGRIYVVPFLVCFSIL